MDFKSVFVAIILCHIASGTVNYISMPDYKNHICNRDCDKSERPLICEYEFIVELYTTLSKACYNCPNNISDCSREQCIAANGVVRPITVVNRMLPGPAIHVCKGDTVSVNVYNSMHPAEALTIHWHGILQKGTPYMDGAEMATQCPILHHNSFEYRFTLNDVGTHFWHAHSGLQRQDGVYGAFIVRDKNSENIHHSRYDYDLSEHVIVLIDWLSNKASTKFVQFYHNNGNNGPEAMLINGKGILYQNGVKSINNTNTPRAKFTVKSGSRYRFRIISAVNLNCPIQFSIDDHNLTVIATDGHDIEPIEVKTITIFAGERYDFILNANKVVKSYWIKAKGLINCGINSVYQTAILNYESWDDTVESLLATEFFNYVNITQPGQVLNPWNTQVNSSNQHEYTQIDTASSINGNINKYNRTVNKKIFLSMEFNRINNNEFQNPVLYPYGHTTKTMITPQLNNISFMMPEVPALYQWDEIPKELLCNSDNKAEICPPNRGDYCSCIHSYEVKLNDLIEIVIVDEAFTAQSNHPFHLHGHSFAVLGIERVNTSISVDKIKEMDQNGLLKRNFKNPPIKDTVTVPAGGYTILRFVADNPGSWLFHCHIEFHAQIGMSLLFKVGTNKDLPPEPIDWPKCRSYKFKSNSNNLVNSIVTLIATTLTVVVYILFSTY